MAAVGTPHDHDPCQGSGLQCPGAPAKEADPVPYDTGRNSLLTVAGHHQSHQDVNQALPGLLDAQATCTRCTAWDLQVDV